MQTEAPIAAARTGKKGRRFMMWRQDTAKPVVTGSSKFQSRTCRRCYLVEYDLLMSSLKGRALILAVVFVSTAVAIRPENANTSAPVAMTSAQVVEQMRQHNQIRADGLKKYKELRHYKVEYTGLTTLSAEMEVEVSFDALSGKTFRIKTQRSEEHTSELQ